MTPSLTESCRTRYYQQWRPAFPPPSPARLGDVQNTGLLAPTLLRGAVLRCGGQLNVVPDHDTAAVGTREETGVAGASWLFIFVIMCADVYSVIRTSGGD